MSAGLNIKTSLTGGTASCVDRNTTAMKVDSSICIATIAGTPNMTYVYQFSASSTLTADGLSVIIPYGQSPGTSGRWLLQGISTSATPASAASVASIVGDGSTPAMFRNRLINGDMRIAQRGGASTLQGYVTVDRWYCARYTGAPGLSTCQVYGAFSSNKYCISLQRDAGNTNTSGLFLSQAIEGYSCKDLAGKTVTLSFLVGTGASVTTTGHAAYILYQTTGSDIGINGSWTALQQTFTVVPGSSFALKSFQFTIPSNATQLTVSISFNVTGTAGVDDRFYITEIQLEGGASPTQFDRRPYGIELGLCKRYYQEVGSFFAGAWDSSTTVVALDIPFPVQMRTAPSISVIPTRYFSARWGGDLSVLNPTIANITNSPDGTGVWLQVTGLTGGSAGMPLFGRHIGYSNFLAASAEY